MLKKKTPDSPVGSIIRTRLEQMERSQPWLARQVCRCTNTINGIIKGRLNPSEELLEKFSSVLSVDISILTDAVKQGGKK